MSFFEILILYKSTISNNDEKNISSITYRILSNAYLWQHAKQVMHFVWWNNFISMIENRSERLQKLKTKLKNFHKNDVTVANRFFDGSAEYTKNETAQNYPRNYLFRKRKMFFYVSSIIIMINMSIYVYIHVLFIFDKVQT